MKARSWVGVLLISLCLNPGGAIPGGANHLAAAEMDLIYFVNWLTDLDRLPAVEGGISSKQFSSYDRASRLGPNGEKIDWEANGDAGHYIRKEESGEAVMAEMEGPGVITQTWSANPQGKLHFYIDGAAKPIVFDFTAFTTGGIPEIPPPVSSKDGAGCNSYLPIPYAKRCAIKADRPHGQYYHFDVLTFPPGTPVRSFSWPLSEAEKGAVARAANWWASRCGEDPGPERPGSATISKEVQIPPRGTALLAEIEGPRAITTLRVKLESPGRFARREVVLRAFWDGAGKPSIESPCGDLFASTWADIPFRSLPIGMTEKGGYCYFRMPFQRTARLEAANLGDQEARLRAEIVHGPWEWTDSSTYFHAKWRREAPNKTFDWPYLKCQGRGRFAGVTMSVQNPDPPWFGEGDEKVYVDGEAFPSWFGTGTEDYFCDAWGFRPFIRPLHGCPLYAEPGRTTVYRWHNQDSIPFTKSFEITIENYGNNKDYSSVAYWYASPPGNDFFKPVTGDGMKPWPLSIPGALEAEAVAQDRDDVVSDTQLPFELSGGKGIRLKAGDAEKLDVPVPEKDCYLVAIFGPKGQKGPGLRARAGNEVLLEVPSSPFEGTNHVRARSRALLEKGKATLLLEALGAPAGESLYIDAIRLDPSPRVPGALEAEGMKATVSDDADAKVVYDPDLEGLSGSAYLQVIAERPGEWAALRLPERTSGRFLLSLRLVTGPEGGIFAAQAGGKDFASPLDGGSAGEGLSGEIVLGTADLPGGDGNELTFVARARKEGSKGLALGIDYLKVKRVLVEGALEAEGMKILAQDRANAQHQMLGDRWSSEGQLFCPGEEGGSVTLELPVKEDGRYSLEIYFTKAADYGIVEVELDGKSIGEKFNGYNDGVIPSGKVLLGAADLAKGSHKLTFRCREKDRRASAFFMGIDCVALVRK